VFQVTLPGLGPGALQSRSAGGAKDASALLNPAIDFYKRLALECSAQQVAVDLFILNSQFADMASISEFLYGHTNFINQKFSCRWDFKVQWWLRAPLPGLPCCQQIAF
jgi:Sec23/Sec24 trunk domain